MSELRLTGFSTNDISAEEIGYQAMVETGFYAGTVLGVDILFSMSIVWALQHHIVPAGSCAWLLAAYSEGIIYIAVVM